MTDTEPVKDWRSLPREHRWLYRVRRVDQSGEIREARLYVKRSGAEHLRAKWEARGWDVTVEVSAFAPVFVPVEDMDSVSSPTRRRLPVVEVEGVA